MKTLFRIIVCGALSGMLAAPAIAETDAESNLVITALLKKFPEMQKMTEEARDISMEWDNQYEGTLSFFTPRWHMFCEFKRDPMRMSALVKIDNCRGVHE